MPPDARRHHAADYDRTIQHPMKAVEVTVADGAETIRVEPSSRGITLTNRGKWTQALTGEEAWQLAEAIDAVSTRAPDPD